MFRARSSLFFVIYLFSVTTLATLVSLLRTNVNQKTALEIWVRNDAEFFPFRAIVGAVFVLSLIALMIFLSMEIAIRRGWEPPSMTHVIGHVRVVGFYRDHRDPEGHRRIEVELRDGTIESFLLDPQELDLCEMGDVILLSTIGQHVAEIRRIEKAEGQMFTSHQAPLRQRWSSRSVTFQILVPLAGAFLIGWCLEYACFGQYINHDEYSGERWLEAHDWVSVMAWVGILGSAAFIVRMLIFWRKGWDNADIDMMFDQGQRSGWD